jgi:2'-5' RNA ligase
MPEWKHNLEQNPDLKFGFYMRPSAEISQAQAMVHDLLRRQFGLVAGGVFMPHATIKGFFRSDASLAEINAACDLAVEGATAIPIVNNGVIAFGRGGLALNVHQDEFGQTNGALQAFHETVMDHLEPLVHPDCTFSAGEWSREKFFAHLTLAMADMPAFAFDEILEFVRELEPLGKPRFLARHFHLYAFHSDAWDGKWWHTLEWKLLNSWTLPLPQEQVVEPTRVRRGWQALSFTEE